MLVSGEANFQCLRQTVSAFKGELDGPRAGGRASSWGGELARGRQSDLLGGGKLPLTKVNMRSHPNVLYQGHFKFACDIMNLPLSSAIFTWEARVDLDAQSALEQCLPPR